ncbi:MAG: hypothetical protein ACJ8CR_28620 [Roseiflexaceae bacterium]
MRKRIFRWLAGAALAAALAAGLLNGGATAPVVYGADPTPTPTPVQTNSDPGGSGGGGG